MRARKRSISSATVGSSGAGVPLPGTLDLGRGDGEIAFAPGREATEPVELLTAVLVAADVDAPLVGALRLACWHEAYLLGSGPGVSPLGA
jgi:hypothetical protein